MRSIRSRWNRLKNGLRALAFWIPRTWGQAPWDDGYLYKLIGDWLEWGEAFYRSDRAWCVGSERTADEMRHARLVLEHICEHDGPAIIHELNDDAPCGLDWGEYAGWANRRAGKSIRANNEYLFRYIARHIGGWWD